MSNDNFKSSSYTFINPYNFVPFGDNNPSKNNKEDIYRGKENQKELLSGWLDVSMYINSPLIIPDGAHPRYFDLKNNKDVSKKEDVKNPRDLHIEYDFLQMYNPYSGEKEYMVPGSALRGMIRSTYEAVTNSCVPFLMNDKPISQRVPLYGALTKRGLLGYNGNNWVLYGTKKILEEVIVIPVYGVEKGKDTKYYVENLNEVRNNKENNKKTKNGQLKYNIMMHLDVVESAVKNYRLYSKQINYNASFSKNTKNKRKWDIKINNDLVETGVEKKIVKYLFVKADGTVVKESTGTYKDGKGVLQYNVPVDTRRVYHIAYLTKQEQVHAWKKSTARGNEDKYKEKDALYAEAYKKLKSSLMRDGASGANVNSACNYALREALESACTNKEVLVPVYYFIVNNGKEEIVYMSGSAAGRIAQRRKWEEIMKEHTPCEEELCPACLLFGTINDGGMKGKLRFTDAYLDNTSKVKRSKHTLQILASPRTTAFEFYLRKPDDDATYWNYDFYGKTISDEGGANSHIEYFHLDKATPRGRKMYWHHKPSMEEPLKSNMNNTMECIEEGKFTFKIYYDQITKDQLNDLIWTITLADNNPESKLQHKLGHAKPLGYGSVKLVVDDGKVRQFRISEQDNKFSISLKDIKEIGIDLNNVNCSAVIDSILKDKLLAMSQFDATKGQKVDYPREKQGAPIYGWFAKNRTNPKTLEVLPEPDCDHKSLGEKRK